MSVFSMAAALSAVVQAQASPASADIVLALAPASRAAACTSGDGVVLGAGQIVAAKPFDRMQGFARVAATSGGLGRRFIQVWRLDDAAGEGTLRAAVDRARRDGGGWIGFAPSMEAGGEIALHAPLRVPANVTIDGGCVAPRITAPPGGSVLYVQRVRNVVLLRLRLSHQEPRVDGKQGGDCITVSHGSDRVWIAYNELSRCTDGLIDITQSGVAVPMRVTVAHNYFHDHDKAMLISGDHCRDVLTSCDIVAPAPGSPDDGVQVTLQANVFLSTGQRHPRVSGRAFVDATGNIVAYNPDRHADGRRGGSYGAFAANGGRLLIRNSLYLALEPTAARRAVLAADPSSPGATRITGLLRVPTTSTAFQRQPALVPTPAYRLDPQPSFAAGAGAAAGRIAATAGVGGWDRVPGATCGTLQGATALRPSGGKHLYLRGAAPLARFMSPASARYTRASPP